VDERRLEVVKSSRIQPFRTRRHCSAQAADAGFAHRELDDSLAVEGDVDTRSLSEPLHVRRVPVARGDREIGRIAFSAFNRWCEHASRSQRGGADTCLADHEHRETTLGCGGRTRQPDQTGADDENVRILAGRM